MCSHCYPLNDVIDDLEATPCPVPVQRVEPRSINVKSSIGRGDTRWPDLPDTLSLTSPDSTSPDLTPLATTPTRTTTSAPDATLAPDSRAPRTATSDVIPAPRATTPDTTPAPESHAQTLDSHASDATPAPDSHAPAPRDTTLAPDSPAPFDLLVELDIQQRHEERAVQLMDEYAVQFVEEDERAARERLQHAVKVYEQVSSDEEAVARWQAAEDCRPQELYIVQRARLLNKRRSNHEHQHEYPAKRGGDSTDAIVVVRYPYIDTEFTVRRFGIQEMDTRHGNVLKFRRAWLLDYHAELRGYHVEGKRWSNIRLYCADQIYRAQLADVYEELYYVDLHFRSKFYATFGKKQPAIEPPKHYQAWCTFVDTYIKANTREANAYEKSLRDREECFYNTSVAGVAMKIHALSLKMRMSCTVPVDVECPSCYSESSRAVIGAQPPSDLTVLHARLQDILKQRRTTTPAPIEHGVVGRLEDEVNKLRADNIKLQARNESLQLNITAEVAVQLSQHFLSMANNVLSNISSC